MFAVVTNRVRQLVVTLYSNRVCLEIRNGHGKQMIKLYDSPASWVAVAVFERSYIQSFELGFLELRIRYTTLTSS